MGISIMDNRIDRGIFFLTEKIKYQPHSAQGGISLLCGTICKPLFSNL